MIFDEYRDPNFEESLASIQIAYAESKHTRWRQLLDDGPPRSIEHVLPQLTCKVPERQSSPTPGLTSYSVKSENREPLSFDVDAIVFRHSSESPTDLTRSSRRKCQRNLYTSVDGSCFWRQVSHNGPRVSIADCSQTFAIDSVGLQTPDNTARSCTRKLPVRREARASNCYRVGMAPNGDRVRPIPDQL